MKIIKTIKVPTGNICIAEGEKAPVEYREFSLLGKRSVDKIEYLENITE